MDPTLAEVGLMIHRSDLSAEIQFSGVVGWNVGQRKTAGPNIAAH